jgi:hypothetical protein
MTFFQMRSFFICDRGAQKFKSPGSLENSAISVVVIVIVVVVVVVVV